MVEAFGGRSRFSLEAGNDGVLGLELGLPVGEDAELFVGEAREVAGDVGAVLGHLGERAAGLAAGEERVVAPGAVEAAARGDVVDLAADGDVDRLGGVAPVVRPQLRRRQLCRHRLSSSLARISRFVCVRVCGVGARTTEDPGGLGEEEE